MLRTIPKETRLFWSPHFNIPVLYFGKLLVTIHDVFHKAMPQYAGAIHKKLYAELMFQAVRRKADQIISVSQFTKDEFHRLVGEVRQPIQTVYNGINNNWFVIERRSSQLDAPYFLFVGNVKPNKNLSRLIRAFKKIMGHIPHKLVVVGKKDGFITGDPKVWNEITELGDRVVFTGYVEDEVLQQYYANATGLVFPSLYEGFGFPPLEAMAVGTPALVSNAASLPEVCGDAVLYFNPNDENEISACMLHLIENVDLQERLREMGAAQAQRFRWQASADQTVTLIHEVMGA
ncbi:glycosyltransferase family 1 protein [Cohnella sp. AR92]|uniref:glycosyltransferase family 4 protein n=1 Tax=Cohnella sp. AR92 TaxID=648716 RepID=UPI001315AD4F|nr:glycosyltransferase family 1 protein [Cohnella sp. AR92]